MIAEMLGPYRVLSKVGEGGMGEVYRATDTKLDRDVALKILPASFASDPDRLMRFEREAKTLAALNHSNIAQIYGFEKEVGASSFLVMELVDGEDLSERIGRGAVALDEALPIARQIADALEVAHEQGIIHRDLKPANIKVRDDGTVKVLDFGLAKALAPEGASATADAANSPTLTARATQIGMILGTAAYMAPEQAKGRPADRRADIWAFGVVLFEMLTGRRAFPGEDVSEVLASVLKSEPDWSTLPAGIPPVLQRLLRRCLEKDPRRRLSAIGDARFDLDEAGTSPAAEDTPPDVTPAAAASRWRLVPWALVAVLTAAVTAQVWFASRPAGNLRPFSFPIEIPVGLASPNLPAVLITTDGTRVVYAAAVDGQERFYTQRLGELDATPIPGTEGADRPFLSPDGRWVAFVAGERLKKVPIEGGTPVELTFARWGGGSWDRDNRIVFTRSYQEGLWEIDAAGGTPSMLTEPDAAKGELGHWWPQVLPDGDHILFVAYRSFGGSTIEVLSRKTKARSVVVSGGVFGRYVPTGHLVYAKDESLFVVRMDAASLTTSGGAVPLLSDVAMSHGDGFAAFDIAANGTLAYLPSSSHNAERDLVFVSRSGDSRAALPGPGRFDHPSLSPDGTRVAVDLIQKGMAADIWVYALDSGRATRVTDSPGEDFAGAWTPDGREIVYTAEQPFYEVWKRVADASQPPSRLIGGDYDRRVSDVSQDGRYVALGSSPADGQALAVVALTGKPEERTYLSGIRNAGKGVFSPDGRWMTYQSDESGRAEVYLQSFPDPTRGRWKLSTDGGSEPLWTKQGREIVYRERDAVMAVSVDPDRQQIGAPRLLFRGPYVFHTAWNDGRSYDVSRDGERFLMLRESPERQRRRIIVTLNWFEEMKEKAAR